MLVGLTGCTGSGQSTLACIFSSLGASVCSLDEVGHRLLGRGPVARGLARELGMPEISAMDGMGIRLHLRRRVFDDPALMQALCSVLHPRMRRWASLSASILRGAEGLFVLEGALLLELGLGRLCDAIVTVACETATCVSRIIARDGLDEGRALARLAMQMPLTEKVERSDWVVWNGSGATEASLMSQSLPIFRFLSGWRNDGPSNS